MICLSEDMFILPSASIIRKKSFDSIGGFDERLSGYEDDDLFLRLFRHGWHNVYFKESLSAWRHYASSTCFSESMIRSRRIYVEKLMQEYADYPDMNYFFARDYIAPRFYNIARNEYNRGLSHMNYPLCRESYLDMKKYAAYFNTSLKETTRSTSSTAMTADGTGNSAAYSAKARTSGRLLRSRSRLIS